AIRTVSGDERKLRCAGRRRPQTEPSIGRRGSGRERPGQSQFAHGASQLEPQRGSVQTKAARLGPIANGQSGSGPGGGGASFDRSQRPVGGQEPVRRGSDPGAATETHIAAETGRPVCEPESAAVQSVQKGTPAPTPHGRNSGGGRRS